MNRPTLSVAVCLAALTLAAAGAAAAVVDFPRDFAGFNAAAGNPAVNVDFDAVAANTNIGGQALGGATFTAIGSPLIVIDASTSATTGTYLEPYDQTNRLAAASGANVLSPGGATLAPGPDPAAETDDLRVDFAQPVGYFGLEHLSQRRDGFNFTRVTAINAAGAVIHESVIPIGASAADAATGIIPGGADFWGIVSDDNDIAAILFNDVDDDNDAPDNNVGYDSIRFGDVSDTPPPVGIPLPAAVVTTPALLALAELARRRFRARRN